jgi:hypothetical protein
MRVVPINEAEAIIEPFWDGGSSEHPGDKYVLLNEWQRESAPEVAGEISQSWCAVEVQIERAEVGETALAMEREAKIELGEYDVLRLFAAPPSWMYVTISARIDGQEHTLLDRAAGVDTFYEFDAPLSGRRMSHLRLEFGLLEDRPAHAQLLWLGLANAAAQRRMEARESPYGADWPACLESAPHHDAPRTFAPQIGILFGADEMEALRAKVTQEPLRSVYQHVRQVAMDGLEMNPEAAVGYYVPKPDPRWVRMRDRDRAATAGIMESLAFVGLIEEKREMLTMAARMALSAAHCNTWCESVIGLFPGATWHHRSFTEEVYCRACALVLDWAGSVITAHGQQVIRDAIIMKGLPRIESDFKRMEYIRHMNQGIVFSSGRIIGLLSLLPAYPRYARQVEEAEHDLHEMIDNYVLPDGGTLEGMGYWSYTFSHAVPLLYALARHRGVPFKTYVPRTVIATGHYALAMLSTAGDGSTYLPINDAHADRPIPSSLVAAYARFSERDTWRDLYAATVQRAAAAEERSAQGAVRRATDLYHLILAPGEPYPAHPLVAERHAALPHTGQADSIRAHEGLGYVHLHLCSGPTYGGHYHQDKGSFILETGGDDGEVLAMDRGITNYDHPETRLLTMAARHNLLYPEVPGRLFVQQPRDRQGGVLVSAVEHEGAVMYVTDNREAWEEGLFARNVRRIFSPWPDLYLFDDDVVLKEPTGVSFRLNSRYPIEVDDGGAWVRGEAASLRIVPLNWTPAETTAAREGIDGQLHPVNLLRLVAAPAQEQRLLTIIQVVPADAGEKKLYRYERDGESYRLRLGNSALRVAPGQEHALHCTVREGGEVALEATCSADGWRVDG